MTIFKHVFTQHYIFIPSVSKNYRLKKIVFIFLFVCLFFIKMNYKQISYLKMIKKYFDLSFNNMFFIYLSIIFLSKVVFLGFIQKNHRPKHLEDIENKYFFFLRKYCYNIYQLLS